MISPERFYNHLHELGVDFFSGVPDSTLKNLLAFFHNHIPPGQHIIAANEGLAVALAAGHQISSGKLPLVYLQNSGLGNAVNPLTSLTDTGVFSIPLLLLIGWRGMPGHHDEPQHQRMGMITLRLLELLNIPCYMLEQDESKSLKLLNGAVESAWVGSRPVALLAPDGLFEKEIMQTTVNAYSLCREKVIGMLIRLFTQQEVVVCTTGKTGREFYELNQAAGNVVPKYFLCVGAMGLANHVGLGIHLHQKKRVVIIDSDGSVLMHLGGLASIGQLAGESFVHVVINNGSHESVGAQPTMGFDVDLCAIAAACGYEKCYRLTDEKELNQWMKNDYFLMQKQFVEIRVNTESRNDVGRPAGKPLDWKMDLMKQL